MVTAKVFSFVSGPNARVCECIFARFSQDKHAFSTSAISSLPSEKDKYPRDGPFRRPSSRDKTNFSILTPAWESRGSDGNFRGWSAGFTINPDDLYYVLKGAAKRKQRPIF